MTTKEAVLDAMTRGKVRKQYKPDTFRKMKQRVKKDEMTIGWQIDFLLKHNYTIKHEFNWSKPRLKKGEAEENPNAVPQHEGKSPWVLRGEEVDAELLTDKFAIRIEHSPQAIASHVLNQPFNQADFIHPECTNHSGKRKATEPCEICGKAVCICSNTRQSVL